MKKIELTVTPVEEVFLQASTMKIIYKPEEKIPAIVVNNFPSLGKLAAFRFIEWVQNNPGGVISLPTGKTPEHFIKWVKQLLSSWNSKKTKELLEENGINPAVKPDMKSLHFVQIDEFYPINSTQHNSFFYYVNKFYIDGFGLDRNKAIVIDAEKIGLSENETLESVWPNMTVDLSLRIRHATSDLEKRQKNVLAKIDQWCQEYEDKIRSLGGIGFFLGGIGPDGHIGFNVQGSDHYSPTRLTETNYET
ncbi:MAG: glucosamine-6-phosphate deaminase, partial [Flavobacterium sp.]|nr:glucosamine-6-phosphate deaminase [Flavobacterium sp.]